MPFFVPAEAVHAMAVQLFRPTTSALDGSLAQAAKLVRTGLTAFLEGNPFRGRRVQESCRQLLADIDTWQDRTLERWPNDQDEAVLQDELRLSYHVEAMARAAQQLAALAETRPATRIQDGLRHAVRNLAEPLEALLAYLADPLALPPGDALAEMRARRPQFMAWCADLGRNNPRMFSSCLLAVAAGQRVEEAAEAAQAAIGLRGVPGSSVGQDAAVVFA